jgi:hypothetical protein
MRTLVAAALGTACAVVALCPSDRPDAAAGASATVGTEVHATLQRSRLFETQRGLRLNLRNDGDDEVRVEAVQLDSPSFETVPAEPRDPVLPAGRGTVAMPVPFGEADCEGDTDGPTTVIVRIDGEDVPLEAEESPPGLLDGLHDAECTVAEVRAQADLRLDERWERTAPRTVVGDVVVDQLEPGAAVTVVGIEGNVIFDLDVVAPDPPDPLVEVDDDRPSGRVEVRLTASRCDPHALIEYKRTFTFVALVDTGGDRPVRVDVTAEGDARAALQTSLTACIG